MAKALSDDQRTVLELTIQDYEDDEIAELCGWSRPKVVSLKRAIRDHYDCLKTPRAVALAVARGDVVVEHQ